MIDSNLDLVPPKGCFIYNRLTFGFKNACSSTGTLAQAYDSATKNSKRAQQLPSTQKPDRTPKDQSPQSAYLEKTCLPTSPLRVLGSESSVVPCSVPKGVPASRVSAPVVEHSLTSRKDYHQTRILPKSRFIGASWLKGEQEARDPEQRLQLLI